jgi:hypothetical protein
MGARRPCRPPASLRLTVDPAAVIPDEMNRSRLTSQSAANRTACILDAVSAGQDHSFQSTRSAMQCKAIHAGDAAFPGLSFIWSAREIPAQDIRCSAIGVAGGADLASPRQLASDGAAHHLHILLEHPPKLSVWLLVNAFKGTSSRRLRRNRADIAARESRPRFVVAGLFRCAGGGHQSACRATQRARFLLARKAEACAR